MSSVSIFTSGRRVQVQTTIEMTPYFTMTKCNKLFITYLTCSTECLPTLPSSISTTSMMVVNRKIYSERGKYVINMYIMYVCGPNIKLNRTLVIDSFLKHSR